MTTPSWLQWPPNCCETCEHWAQTGPYHGECSNPASTQVTTVTDSRFRCQDFHRAPKVSKGLPGVSEKELS